MSITADIEKAAAKLQGDIDAAEFNLNGKKKTLAILQKECDQAEKALLKAEMAQYNARKKVVQKYIDDVLMKMKEPDCYDPNRVAKLRGRLANFPAKDGYEYRIKVLTAVRELQLILTKFPIEQRVGDIIREWTGNKKVLTPKDGTHKLIVNGNVLMHVMHKLPDPKNAWWTSVNEDFKRRNLLDLQLSEGHYSGTPCRRMHNFWEMACMMVPMDPEFVIGEPPVQDVGMFGLVSRNPKFEDKYNIREIGKELFYIRGRAFSEFVAWMRKEDKSIKEITMTDTDWAGNLIALNPGIFTVKEVISNYDRLCQYSFKNVADSYHNAKHHVDFIIERTTEELQKCAPKTVRDIKFDADLMAITWRDPYDKDMAFDPDTCEMQHPSKVIHKLDVSNVRLSNVCMYAYKHIEGMAKPEKDI